MEIMDSNGPDSSQVCVTKEQAKLRDSAGHVISTKY